MRLELPQDYEDLLTALVAEAVDFVLIGGWAVAVHGHGRATDDLDLLVRANAANAEAILRALHAFGAPIEQHGVDATLFATEGPGYRMGRRPVLVEILTKISGIDYAEATRDTVPVQVGAVTVRVIGRAALLRNKRAAGRLKDLADIEALGTKRHG
ncbi:MAG: hypothetical protein H6747_09780 [Deltaproteobacteria bacterium]|nr:hypothetical protein [Deltaproteobacteria bacterium]